MPLSVRLPVPVLVIKPSSIVPVKVVEVLLLPMVNRAAGDIFSSPLPVREPIVSSLLTFRAAIPTPTLLILTSPVLAIWSVLPVAASTVTFVFRNPLLIIRFPGIALPVVLAKIRPG